MFTETAPHAPDPACLAMPDWAPSARNRRVRRGRQAHQSGLAAEEIALRAYAARGVQVLARRHRTPHGEIDLILQDGQVLIFVEVKQRKRAHAFDSPVSDRQWRRLGCAAQHYMLEHWDVTRQHPVCRFDAALVGSDGRAEIIENARTFD